MNMEDYFRMLNEAVERNARERDKNKPAAKGEEPHEASGGPTSRY